MFTLSSNLIYYLYLAPTDMRKSFDNLSGIVCDHLELKPLNSSVLYFHQ